MPHAVRGRGDSSAIRRCGGSGSAAAAAAREEERRARDFFGGTAPSVRRTHNGRKWQIDLSTKVDVLMGMNDGQAPAAVSWR
jgi:hypothetical protein